MASKNKHKGKSSFRGSKKKRYRKCKMCKNKFRIRIFPGEVFGKTFADTCERALCKKRRVELWIMMDAERRLAPDEDKPPHFVVDKKGTYQVTVTDGKMAVVGPVATGKISKTVKIESSGEFMEVFGGADARR